jgi:hypothetical protein
MSGTGPKYKRRKDGNHNTLAAQLADVPGVFVQDVSRFPGLGFDLIVTCHSRRPGFLLLVEIKREKDPAPLSPSEQRARAALGENWIEANSIEPILARLGLIESQEIS